MWSLWAAWSFIQDNFWWLLGAGAAVAVILALAVTTRSWKLFVEGLGALTVILGAGKLYRAGADAQRRKQEQANDRTIARTREEQQRVDRMKEDEVDREINRWIEKDKP